MDLEKRLRLIQEVGEEIITEESLRALLEKKKQPIAYDGFEPSGQMHIAQGLLRTINVNKMVKAGCKFKFLWQTGMHGQTTSLKAIWKRFRRQAGIWKRSGRLPE